MNKNIIKKLQKVANTTLEIRTKTLERLYSSLGKNIEVLSIKDSINKNNSDYRLTLRDKNTGLLKEINYNTLIQNKNKLCSISGKNKELKVDGNIEDMKISDILNIGNKNRTIETTKEKDVDETLNIKLDKETKRLLEERSNGNVSEFCRNIIKDGLSNKQQNNLISNNDEKYEILTNMIKELAEKISNLSVNVSFSK